MANFYTIKEDVIHEIEIKKSRFITYLYPIKTQEEFDEKLRLIKKEHYKATHHCQAWILGEDMDVQRQSDDGEPGGTAGMPMLEVLKQNNLTNIMAVVVRYFGGIKLGAGGLIRAYSSSVSETLKHAQIMANITQMVVNVTLDYSHVDSFNYQLEQTNHPVNLLDTTYTDKVTFKLAINLDAVDLVKEELINRFSGQLEWVELGEERVYISVDSSKE